VRLWRATVTAFEGPGDECLIGRIVAVADAYDAMTSDRTNRTALQHEIACGELERCTGSQFDLENRAGVPGADRGVPEDRGDGGKVYSA